MAPGPGEVLKAFGEDGCDALGEFLADLFRGPAGVRVRQSRGDPAGRRRSSTAATAERAFYPIAVFINTIPIIAVAPILVLIFGNGLTPKIIIAALICFFPTLVNMVRGLKAVSPRRST